MHTLETEVVREGDIAVIRLTGDIDGSAEEGMGAAWDQTAGAREVLLHFGATEYINSTGIALIVGLLARARAERVEVRATGLSPHYREIFEITRLSDFMTILPDAPEAAAGGTTSGLADTGGARHGDG